MIEVKGLVKNFGPKRAVDGVSFTVRQGDILGFLGPNGAGKSTTMKMITGYLRADSGVAMVDGIDVAADPVAVKRRLGYLPENAPAYPEMTVEEFLGFIAEVRGYRGAERRERIARAVALTHLEPVRRQSLETLSKGYKQRVGFAQALLHDPPTLVLDEPTDGLDPNQKNEVRELIRGMASAKAVDPLDPHPRGDGGDLHAESSSSRAAGWWSTRRRPPFRPASPGPASTRSSAA